MKKNNKGITLITLCVTIIITIILATITLSIVLGDDGIIEKTRQVKLDEEMQKIIEEVKTRFSEKYIYGNSIGESGKDISKEIRIVERGTDADGEYAIGIYKGTTIKLIYNEKGKVKEILKTTQLSLEDLQRTEMIVKWQVSAGETITLPIRGFDWNNNEFYFYFIVDWGDETEPETFINNESTLTEHGFVATHTFQNSEEYIITIAGNFDMWDAATEYDGLGHEGILEVVQWGECAVSTIYFYECCNLTTIATPTENSFINITNFSSAFVGCTSLESIPEGLFDNCPAVTDFEGTFAGCTSLESIPEGLFDNCPTVTDFGSTFANCTSLESIPEGLFDNCPNVEYFPSTFAGCINLTGNPIELWTRGTNSEENYYMGSPDGNRCYNGCSQLTGYDNIPAYWVGGHNI